jgi:hypothetical protein
MHGRDGWDDSDGHWTTIYLMQLFEIMRGIVELVKRYVFIIITC